MGKKITFASHALQQRRPAYRTRSRMFQSLQVQMMVNDEPKRPPTPGAFGGKK